MTEQAYTPTVADILKQADMRRSACIRVHIHGMLQDIVHGEPGAAERWLEDSGPLLDESDYDVGDALREVLELEVGRALVEDEDEDEDEDEGAADA